MEFLNSLKIQQVKEFFGYEEFIHQEESFLVFLCVVPDKIW